MSNKAHTQAFFHSHFLSEKHNGLMNDCDIVIMGYKPIDIALPTELSARWHIRTQSVTTIPAHPHAWPHG
jgi:hypothetical protein